MIERYLNGFRGRYPFENIELRGLQSNLWAYEGNTISSVYLTNIQEHLGKHIRETVNRILDVRKEKQSLRNRATPQHIKRNIRVFFECLTQFKEIISTTVFTEILATPHVLDEIEAFGPEFSEALYILAPVLTAASLGRENFTQNLW